MSLIGIYSDVHISHNSSIMPTYNNDTDVYTTRLDMCKKSIEWAYSEFAKRKVDFVVNCGDMYDSHTISSDEMHTLVHSIENIYKPYEALSWTPNLDITIPGNHDKFNNTFNSLEFLKLIGYTQLVDKYTYFNTMGLNIFNSWDCYAISFQDAKDFVNIVYEMLNKYPRVNSKAVLFMHGDINGSMLSGGKRITDHIGTDFLTDHFDLIINGHIHCHERIYNQNDKRIYNIGSLTSHSFADSNNHIPACYILNTETEEIEQISNPHAIVFKSYEIINDNDLNIMFNDITKSTNKIIVKIKCPIELKEKIENIIKDMSQIIKSKFVFTYNKEISNNFQTDEIEINIKNDIKDEFVTFLSGRQDLKGNVDDYVSVIN